MNKIELYLGDCLEKMKLLEDKSVDMILCDLPYGTTQNTADIIIPFKLLWKEYSRIIKDNGCIVLFAQGLFYIDLVNSNLKMFRYDLIWDKNLTSGFLNAKRMPLRQHEQIAIFYKKHPTYNPQFTIGNPLHSKGNNYKNKKIINNNYGEFNQIDDLTKGSTEKYPTSILRFSKPHASIAKHRTEKPVQLLEYLIKTYTNENEIVLDNCFGSCSTGIACINTKRNFIGMEMDSNYFNIGTNRVLENKNLVNDFELIVHE